MTLTLYSFPGACSLVSHIALEWVEADFTVEFVDLKNGENKSPSFLALNPRGKVPALMTPAGIITETMAILTWLADEYPNRQLLPRGRSIDHAKILSDLGWFASGVHPFITRVVVPGRFVQGEECSNMLRSSALQGLAHEFELLNTRLIGRQWWLDAPSALDAYVFWLWARVCDSPFDVSPYSALASHARRMLEMPATQRALARERTNAPCFEKLTARSALRAEGE